MRPTRHGKGLVVTAPVRQGGVILVDAPFAACQARGSRARALACAACGVYLSSAGGQLAHGLLSSGVDDDDDGDGAQTLLRLVAGAADAAAGPRLARGATLLPPRPCPGGCSDELYCSDACARSDWETGHALLCGGADPECVAFGRVAGG